jgi:biotin synthase
MIRELVDKIICGEKLSEKEAHRLICEDPADVFWGANKIRQHFKNRKVFTCAIINAKSGLCSEDCAFCAQSKYHNTGVKVYPLLPKEKLIEQGILMAEKGATNFSFVTSGKLLSKKEIDTICESASVIKQKTNLNLCASLGMLDEDRAKSLKEAGISRYHHNLETARSFFNNICTTHDFEEDIETIHTAKKAGPFVCSGGIMGLGEDFSQRIELACLLRDLDVDSIPINFLNPIKGTKLENRELLPPMEALLCIAIFRFINPSKDITICGGREVCLRDFQSWVFLAGANGLMIGNYLTTMGRDIDADLNMIKDMELKIENE